MSEMMIVAALALVFGLGVLVAVTGVARRSWGMVMLGAAFVSMPMGFATVVVAMS